MRKFILTVVPALILCVIVLKFYIKNEIATMNAAAYAANKALAEQRAAEQAVREKKRDESLANIGQLLIRNAQLNNKSFKAQDERCDALEDARPERSSLQNLTPREAYELVQDNPFPDVYCEYHNALRRAGEIISEVDITQSAWEYQQEQLQRMRELEQGPQ